MYKNLICAAIIMLMSALSVKAESPTATLFRFFPGTCHIEGCVTTSDNTESSMILYCEDRLSGEKNNILIPINDDHTFAADVELPMTGFYTLQAPNKSYSKIWLAVGDTVKLNIYPERKEIAIEKSAESQMLTNGEYLRQAQMVFDDFPKSNVDADAYSIDGLDSLVMVMAQRIDDDLKHRTPIQPDEEISPLAADVMNLSVVSEGINRLYAIIMSSMDRRFILENDENGNSHLAGINPDYRKLDYSPVSDVLARHGLLDNESFLLLAPGTCYMASYIGDDYCSIKNPAGIIVDKNLGIALIPEKRELPSRFSQETMDSLHSDTYPYLTLSAALKNGRDSLKATGINPDSFFAQMVMLKNNIKFTDNPDDAAGKTAALAEYITHPLLSRKLMEIYRRYIIAHESSIADNGLVHPILDSIIEPYKGNTLLVDFWDMGCGPCRAGMVWQKPLLEKLSGMNVEFIYVANGEEPERRRHMEKWMDENNIKGRHIFISTDDWRGIEAELNFNSIPFTMIIDESGKIVMTEPQEAEYQEYFENMLNSK